MTYENIIAMIDTFFSEVSSAIFFRGEKYVYFLESIAFNVDMGMQFYISINLAADSSFIEEIRIYTSDILLDRPLSLSYWHIDEAYPNDLDILQQQYKDYLKGRNYD